MANDLVSTAEAAALLGVTRQRVHQLRQEHDDFPAPAVEHPRAVFGKWRDVERWGRRHGYIDKEA